MNELFLRNQMCIPVKGYNRAIIYDIIRRDYFFISKEHHAVLDTNDFIKFNKILDESDREELFNLLIKEEIIFELRASEQKTRFKALDRNFHTPNLLNNVVIHSNIDEVFFDFIIEEYLLNLTIIAPSIDDDLYNILAKIKTLEVDSVYLYIENFDENSFLENRDLLSNHNLVFSVNFFKVSNTNEKNQVYENVYFNFFQQEFSTYKSKLTEDKLNINIEHFLESYNFHSYYFGKVYIDQGSNVKNGLTNCYSFGNLQKLTKELFQDIVESQEFRELGSIKKKDTLVCCDCEFRYMCVDSRVPIKGDQKWYHTVECTYNPYLSIWENEEGYVNLQDSGVTVSASGCTIDKKKLSRQFKKLWAV